MLFYGYFLQVFGAATELILELILILILILIILECNPNLFKEKTRTPKGIVEMVASREFLAVVAW